MRRIKAELVKLLQKTNLKDFEISDDLLAKYLVRCIQNLEVTLTDHTSEVFKPVKPRTMLNTDMVFSAFGDPNFADEPLSPQYRESLREILLGARFEPGVHRLMSLQRLGLLGDYTLIIGPEEIRYFFRWSKRLFAQKVKELEQMGVVFRQATGDNSSEYCTYPALILRYTVLKAQSDSPV